MSFFRKIFGKSDKDAGSSAPDSITDAEQFEKEFRATMPRYLSTPGEDIKFNMKHTETNEILSLAAAFPEEFKIWKTVRSIYDRRSIIYKLLDSAIGNQLELWQIIERFTNDRYPEKALSIAQDNPQPHDINTNYLTAVARTYFVLTNYQLAENNVMQALDLDSTNVRAKMVLADIYHCTDRHLQSHEIYNDILRQKLSKEEQMNLSFEQLVGFDGDILHSPIYALAWLQNDPRMNEVTWEWANDEFYYSPHLRSQNAYYLIEKKDSLKGLVKILILAKEMPWFKEAVINSYQLIDKLGLQDKMQEEQLALKHIIEKNNWTSEGI